MLSLNKVLVVGRVTEQGVKIQWAENGTPETRWTLVVEEPGQAGATFRLFVPCCAYGKTAEAIGEQVNAADGLYLDGKLKWRSWIDKAGAKQGRLELMVWTWQKVEAATPAEVAR